MFLKEVMSVTEGVLMWCRNNKFASKECANLKKVYKMHMSRTE